MDKILSFFVKIYRWVTLRVPLRILHCVICLLVAMLSIEVAVGLSIGRESQAMDSVSRLKDSLGDLIADVIGIAIGGTIKYFFL